MLAKIKVADKTRLIVTYIKQASEGSYPQRAFYCTLADIVGSKRDIDWKYGRTRRFLMEAEGFNCSIHNTIVFASKEYNKDLTTLQYHIMWH